ncbi:MAG: ABC transporter permease [Hyphomicrobiales bacterium]|nr:ABC transporter permease [Hyphomicrobiales bacterium]
MQDAVAIIAVAVLFVTAWQFLPPLFGIPRYIIPTFSQCMVEIPVMIAQDALFAQIISSAWAALAGFVLGSLFGAACGYGLGLSPLFERVLAPYLLALQIAPKVAFAPLFIMWFGYNDLPKVLVTALIVFFPILVNVLQSMKTVDPDLVRLARAFSMRRAQIFWKVEFPASMPSLTAGLRIGATLAVIGVTVGELVGGNSGLGYLITYGEGQADTAMVFDAIILLTLLGIALYGAVAALERRILHYLPRIAHS